jgi:protein involved in polysaccharide export with SLBB domain
MAGLTAEEATVRLAADPDMHDFRVKITLLRLQQFGFESLKPFGYDLFQGVPSTFAPVSDIQVPPDYVVGPGDTINVQLYGGESANYSLTVGRDGRVNFPKLGPIMVSGMSYDAARATIEHRVGQQLIGTRVSVTMGELRSIRVFVLGEAEKPGSYTVSGLSTMTNALFVSGGVKKIGSLRNIQLKRNGQLITVLDLYELLLHGNTSGDRQLMPGDVIFIPPIGATVSVDGAVRRPAVYELKSEKDVAQAIDLSSEPGRTAALVNGDKLRVPAIRPTLENSVTLSGFVFRPGAFEYRAGLRLSDILTSFDELRPNADRHYIMIRREVPPEQKVAVVSADLERALKARGSPADPELRPRDQIFVFDLSASRERIVSPVVKDLELQGAPDEPAEVVSVDGRVKAPGRYPLEPGMRVSDLIRAGGSMEDAAYGSEAELTRYEVFDGKSRLTELVKINLAAIRRGDAAADIRLKPYDVLIIQTTPQWDEPGNIELAGEVRFPGKYPIHRGETLHSVLQRAGGFTDIAFGEGAVFIREELKRREKEQLELLTNRFQSDLTSLSLQALANTSGTANGSANATQGIVVGQQLLEQLRNTKPVGRLVIDIDRVLRGPSGVPGDVVLRDGDKLFIPKKTQEITILGEVQSPTSHIYIQGLSRDDYIARSGGITQKADKKRIYVVRANGDVISGERTGWFRRSQSTDMRPGDTIVVPLDAERIRALPLWTAVTTIIYNIAIAVLALRNL